MVVYLFVADELTERGERVGQVVRMDQGSEMGADQIVPPPPGLFLEFPVHRPDHPVGQQGEHHDRGGFHEAPEALLAAAERFVELLSVGDVPYGGDDIEPRPDFDGAELHVDRDARSALLAQGDLEADSHRSSIRLVEKAGAVSFVPARDVIGNQVLDRAADQLFGAVGGELLEVVIGEDDDTVGVHHGNGVRQGMQDGT